MVAGSERSARARHKLLGKALRGALWRVVGCGGRVEVRARAWGLSKVFEIGAQSLSMSRARAPTPTLAPVHSGANHRESGRTALCRRALWSVSSCGAEKHRWPRTFGRAVGASWPTDWNG